MNPIDLLCDKCQTKYWKAPVKNIMPPPHGKLQCWERRVDICPECIQKLIDHGFIPKHKHFQEVVDFDPARFKRVMEE